MPSSFMRVLFFAQSRQAAGCADCILQPHRALTQPEFWEMLVELFPDLAMLQKSARLARRETYLPDDALLQPNDEIAVIPPVSGG